MRVNYATNNGFSEEHTGANVPLFANRTDQDSLAPFMKQRDLHGVIADFLLLKRPDERLRD